MLLVCQWIAVGEVTDFYDKKEKLRRVSGSSVRPRDKATFLLLPDESAKTKFRNARP